MKFISNVVSKAKNSCRTVASFLAMGVSMSTFAAIPGVEESSGGADADSGMFEFASGWVQDIIKFGVPTLLACVFLWMMWELWTKIQEQRQAKEPHWGSVMAFGGGVVVYFIVATFIGAKVLAIYS